MDRTLRADRTLAAPLVALALGACVPAPDAPARDESMQARLDQYATVRLTSDLSNLSEADRDVVRLLIEAAAPMHEAFWVEAWGSRDSLMAMKLREEAARASDPGLARYLELRAEALLTDQYRESDLAWMDMKTNPIDVVVGPIESYEDQLLGLKASHEAFVLIKDQEWSRRLQRYAAFLPDLQRELSVPPAFKRERPGADADLNAYDVVFVAGDANEGSKTIAINLPNDEGVQLQKGTRRLQLKNAMRAKFETILEPLADVLIVPDQRARVTFDAFFGNVMFHEVAHGLGIKNLVAGSFGGQGTVREALKEYHSALEEGKADILGLYLVERLRERGEIPEGALAHNYVTFVASIFRSIRFGASSAHGRANMVAFNYLMEHEAVTREAAGAYRVDLQRMGDAVRALSETILTLQGRGDYEGAGRLLAERGTVGAVLQADLDRLAELDIPVDIVYEQGTSVLFANPNKR